MGRLGATVSAGQAYYANDPNDNVVDKHGP